MKRLLLAAVAALSLAACADARQSPVEPAAPRLAVGDWWNIFGSMKPTDSIDATGGWEVATRFKVSTEGAVVRMRFYRVTGETGTNTLKLWSNSGVLLASKNVVSTGAGWKTVLLRTPFGADDSVCLEPDTYYRVSVNTNTKQGKTFAYFTNNGPITNGPLTADYSYYGQPTGSMPTTGSGSAFFVDVTFEEGGCL
jgi:hypothetical protein